MGAAALCRLLPSDLAKEEPRHLFWVTFYCFLLLWGWVFSSPAEGFDSGWIRSDQTCVLWLERRSEVGGSLIGWIFVRSLWCASEVDQGAAGLFSLLFGLLLWFVSTACWRRRPPDFSD